MTSLGVILVLWAGAVLVLCGIEVAIAAIERHEKRKEQR